MPYRTPTFKPQTLTRGHGEYRASAHARGYDSNWKRLRLLKLTVNPLCEECNSHNVIRPAQEVDHIRPISRGGARLDLNNLQSLCKTCHSQKTAR